MGLYLLCYDSFDEEGWACSCSLLHYLSNYTPNDEGEQENILSSLKAYNVILFSIRIRPHFSDLFRLLYHRTIYHKNY